MRRKFTPEQQEEIIKRDGYCLLCGIAYNLSKPHHIFYGTHTPKSWRKGDDINGIWNGATLCEMGHRGFHHTSEFCNGDSLKHNRSRLEIIAQERYENNNT